MRHHSSRHSYYGTWRAPAYAPISRGFWRSEPRTVIVAPTAPATMTDKQHTAAMIGGAVAIGVVGVAALVWMASKK